MQDVEIKIEAPSSAEEQARKRRSVLGGLVTTLTNESLRRIGARSEIERRWLEDLRQYHGVYEHDIEMKLKEKQQSLLFINVTRSKTNSAEARLVDMLFPTDDKNWGITPTPVPELTTASQESGKKAGSLVDQANSQLAQGDDLGAAEAAAQADQFAQKAAAAQAVIEDAKRRCNLMELEIEDQLIECNYNVAARDVIRDACRLGTGIMKGPVRSQRPKKQWKQVQDTVTQKNMFGMFDVADDTTPCFYRVDPWAFFPDPDSLTLDGGEGFFERHIMRKKDLRALAKLPGIDQEAIKELLSMTPKLSAPSYMTDLRAITGSTIGGSLGECYEVWEYYGYITYEQLKEIHQAMGKEWNGEEVDLLSEAYVCAMFCQGVLIKCSEYHLDSNEPIYSVFNWEKDDASVFGYGIPRVMRDSQSALNGAWRMMMDNAGLSTGPQILINKGCLIPADGDWTLTPRKIWHVIDTTLMPGVKIMETFEINSHQPELMAIIELARRLIDEETGISTIAQGEQGATATRTAQGMALLMNSANVVFKRVVRNFDDDLTTPCIRRAYHWNMQFSAKDEIKGDYCVNAKGSSTLVVRDLMATNIGNIILSAVKDPALGSLTKLAPAYRTWVKSLQIPVEDFVLSDEDIRIAQDEAKNQPPPPDPEMEKLKVQMQIAQLESDSRLKVAQLTYDAKLAQAAETRNIELDRIDVQKELKKQELDVKERGLAVETAMAQQTGNSAGGSI